ncbi:MAG: hypothetical protein AVDCRST_MAG79-2572, partial [uncultured Thermoleophilia bacterium]
PVREGMPDHHCEDVADFSGLVAEALGLDAETVVRCRVAGWLHDIGKIAIPAEILAKPMSLTADEWRVMRTHAALGADIVARIPALADAEPVVRHHHERFDGTGYPAGLAGTHIPIEARIVAAADTFSAIVSNAPFRRAQNLATAIEELRRSGGSQLDPEVTEALCRVLESDTPDRRTRQHGRRPAGT